MDILATGSRRSNTQLNALAEIAAEIADLHADDPPASTSAPVNTIAPMPSVFRNATPPTALNSADPTASRQFHLSAPAMAPSRVVAPTVPDRSSKNSRQTTMDSFNHPVLKEGNELAWAEFFYEASIPFNVVSLPSFQRLQTLLQKVYDVPL